MSNENQAVNLSLNRDLNKNAQSLDKDEIFTKYLEIMQQEYNLRLSTEDGALAEFQPMLSPERIYRLVWRILEVAQSAFVPRSYNASYNLWRGDLVYESVSSHTNLVSCIVSFALDFLYGGGFGCDGVDNGMNCRTRTNDGYSYREIMEAVRLHDLAENRYGDIPDNGARDEKLKNQRETEYFKEYLDAFPPEEKAMADNIFWLLDSMQQHFNSTGRLLYLSDKIAALLITLALDQKGFSPTTTPLSPFASERDIAEMEYCANVGGKVGPKVCRASEMWAVDFFKMRAMVNLDETFFFTAIIVMTTLVVHGHWYTWREEDYRI